MLPAVQAWAWRWRLGLKRKIIAHASSSAAASSLHVGLAAPRQPASACGVSTSTLCVRDGACAQTQSEFPLHVARAMDMLAIALACMHHIHSGAAEAKNPKPQTLNPKP